jgi:hypothetical protein
MKVSFRPSWHERKLPNSWDHEEVQFFRNWIKCVASSHKTLAVTAASRLKLLRRARNTYFKLAHKLTQQIRATTNRGQTKRARSPRS